MSFEKYFVVCSIFQPKEVPFQGPKNYIQVEIFNTTSLMFLLSQRIWGLRNRGLGLVNLGYLSDLVQMKVIVEVKKYNMIMKPLISSE